MLYKNIPFNTIQYKCNINVNICVIQLYCWEYYEQRYLQHTDYTGCGLLQYTHCNKHFYLFILLIDWLIFFFMYRQIMWPWATQGGLVVARTQLLTQLQQLQQQPLDSATIGRSKVITMTKTGRLMLTYCRSTRAILKPFWSCCCTKRLFTNAASNLARRVCVYRENVFEFFYCITCGF